MFFRANDAMPGELIQTARRRIIRSPYYRNPQFSILKGYFGTICSDLAVPKAYGRWIGELGLANHQSYGHVTDSLNSANTCWQITGAPVELPTEVVAS